MIQCEVIRLSILPIYFVFMKVEVNFQGGIDLAVRILVCSWLVLNWESGSTIEIQIEEQYLQCLHVVTYCVDTEKVSVHCIWHIIELFYVGSITCSRNVGLQFEDNLCLLAILYKVEKDALCGGHVCLGVY